MMEAPQQQPGSSESADGERVGLNGTNSQTRGTPKSSTSPARGTCYRCVNPRPIGHVGHRNGGNNRSTDKPASSSSWADQIQEGHHALRPFKLQVEVSSSGQAGAVADNQVHDSKCIDAMTTQQVESLGVNNAPLVANGSTANSSQPQAGPTNSGNESAEQALTIQEEKRMLAMYFTAGVFVFVVWALVIWKECNAIVSTTLECEPETNPSKSAPTRWAAWADDFQDMVDGPWI